MHTCTRTHSRLAHARLCAQASELSSEVGKKKGRKGSRKSGANGAAGEERSRSKSKRGGAPSDVDGEGSVGACASTKPRS